MVLDRDDWKAPVAQPLDAAVVEVALADEPGGVGGQGLGVDLELVVLGGHVDRATQLVAHRVVATVVAEAEARRGGPGGLAEDLVAEADAEDRHAAFEQLAGQADLALGSRDGSPGPSPSTTP